MAVVLREQLELRPSVALQKKVGLKSLEQVIRWGDRVNQELRRLRKLEDRKCWRARARHIRKKSRGGSWGLSKAQALVEIEQQERGMPWSKSSGPSIFPRAARPSHALSPFSRYPSYCRTAPSSSRCERAREKTVHASKPARGTTRARAMTRSGPETVPVVVPGPPARAPAFGTAFKPRTSTAADGIACLIFFPSLSTIL